jgi:hypothetical protein
VVRKEKFEKRDPILVFLFSLLTLGIYAIYWFVVTKDILNKKGAEIPTAWLLIIPFVNWYWLYRFAEGFSKKITKDNHPLLWFLLLFFGGWLMLPVLQYEINKTL